LLKKMKNKDIVLQRDSPSGLICTGFFVCRANEKTLKLWNDIKGLIHESGSRDDQGFFNDLVFYMNPLGGVIAKNRREFFQKNKISLMSRVFHEIFRKCLIKLSQYGFNSHRVRWGYLPPDFFGGGTLTACVWSPGDSLPIPHNILLHHANWTVGLENKIAQLKYVKSVVDSRK